MSAATDALTAAVADLTTAVNAAVAKIGSPPDEAPIVAATAAAIVSATGALNAAVNPAPAP